MYYVYILYSAGIGSYYKGSTENVHRRLARHNAGTEPSTRLGIPWILLWFTSKESRGEAMQLERKLKNLDRARSVAFMLKYSEGVAGSDALQWLLQRSEGAATK
jgi:putative endonuclease